MPTASSRRRPASGEAQRLHGDIGDIGSGAQAGCPARRRRRIEARIGRAQLANAITSARPPPRSGRHGTGRWRHGATRPRGLDDDLGRGFARRCGHASLPSRK